MRRHARAVVHGGPDDGPPIRVDFSTNAHPMGAPAGMCEHIASADRSRYPDPGYTDLRRELAELHGVDAEQIVVGAGASELIWRLTRAWSERPRAAVVTNRRTFGEYARAAAGVGVPMVSAKQLGLATPLFWHCNPDNPTGATMDARIEQSVSWFSARQMRRSLVAVDLAYWPFRQLLAGQRSLTTLPAWGARVIQLWSPNKLYGLTGVRGAYLVLPERAGELPALRLTGLAPSWVLGVDGVALLSGHARREYNARLLETAPILAGWKQQQDERLQRVGWEPQPSELHFGLWRPPVARSRHESWHASLRECGIKLRDAASFGRPGWVRLVTRSPEDVSALLAATARFARRPASGRLRT
jgi:histidinol-phosphate aminotransferase